MKVVIDCRGRDVSVDETVLAVIAETKKRFVERLRESADVVPEDKVVYEKPCVHHGGTETRLRAVALQRAGTEMRLKLEELTAKTIGAAIEVHKALGPGLLECRVAVLKEGLRRKAL